MDDDQLMIVLRAALAPDKMVSQRVVDAAESAFRWLRADDDLAELVFDSADEVALAGMRGTAQRQLTYRFDDLLIDCEVGHEAMLGVLIPVGPARIELWSADGRLRTLDLDDESRFIAEPAPAGPVRIRCTRAGRSILTPWLLPSTEQY